MVMVLRRVRVQWSVERPWTVALPRGNLPRGKKAGAFIAEVKLRAWTCLSWGWDATGLAHDGREGLGLPGHSRYPPSCPWNVNPLGS